MQIIEIQALDNGAHRNQSGINTIPQGWAVIPDNMTLENFPFGEVTAKEINGIMTVTKWVAGTMPEITPTPEPTPEPTAEEMLNALVGGMTHE